MNDVNELWSSPWRKLQKNLASGFGSNEAGVGLPTCEVQTPARAASSSSWLMRARSADARARRVIQ